MKREVIIALDFRDKCEVNDFLDKFQDREVYTKVGMELFYSEGIQIIKEIKSRGHKIFLDLKLHDIPNTVKSAMRILGNMNIDMVNLHCAGGMEMMRAGLEGVAESLNDGKGVKIIGVTMLTSTSQERMRDEIGISGDIDEIVLKYAKNAKTAGLSGVVCSPLEAAMIKREIGDDFIVVTPGIRFDSEDSDDQRRFTTPAAARETGADFIVVGRPVIRADNPIEAYRKCVDDFAY